MATKNVSPPRFCIEPISVNAVIVNDAVCRTMATLRPAPSTLQRVALVSEGILKVIYMGWPRDRLGGLSL